MKHLHDQEKLQFESLFKQEGISRVHDRMAVLDLFLGTEQHVTATEFADIVKAARPELDAVFVNDCIRLMLRFGFAHEIRFEGEPVRYEHRHLGQHHDHLVCTRCGEILEFEDPEVEALQEKIAKRHGFTLLQHKMDLYGLCRKCNGDRQSSMPLPEARAGEMLVIEAFTGGSTSRMRLLSMGLRIGDRVEIITSQGKGQQVVAVGTRRYVLGRGLSEKIRVRKGEPKPVCPEPGHAKGEPCRHSLPASEAGEDAVFLSALREGESGIIAKVGGCGMLRRRLLEMGLTRGSHVHVEKYAPLRDPMEVIIKGTHVSLRVGEARHILIEKDG